jgi:outer membrane receptor protein involved in Fe transport
MSWAKIGNADVPDVRTYDLARVEVLRGPQGTLYGGGSIGGVVRILTMDPVLGEFQTKADVTGSRTNNSDDTNSAYKGAINVPLYEDKLALRVSGTKETIAGWIDNSITGESDVNDRDAETYRGKLRYAPNDDLNIVLGYSNYSSDGGFTPSFSDVTTNQPSNTFNTDYNISSLTIDYDFGNVQMTSATASMDYKANAVAPFIFPFGTFFLDTVDKQRLFSQEVRFASPIEGRFYWTGGVYYRKITRTANGSLPPFFSFGQTETSKSDAVFGEGTWRFLDNKLAATLGLRYFEDKRHQVDTVTGLPPVDGKFDAVSPRFNIAYKPNDDWMLYANAGRGFRSGLTQAAVSIFAAAQFGIVAPPSVDPETAWSYEFGAKGSAFDGRLSLEAAVYYISWKDLQLTVQPDPNIPSAAFIINAGDARSRGFEASAIFKATRRLTLEGGFSVIDPEYQDNIASPGIAIVKGQTIPNVPDLTWNASALYERELTASLNGFARIGIQNVGEETSSTGLLTSASRTFTDARLGIQSAHWGAYLFCTNLTDDDTPYGAVADPNGLAGRATPRTIGINLRYNY